MDGILGESMDGEIRNWALDFNSVFFAQEMSSVPTMFKRRDSKRTPESVFFLPLAYVATIALKKVLCHLCFAINVLPKSDTKMFLSSVHAF